MPSPPPHPPPRLPLRSAALEVTSDRPSDVGSSLPQWELNIAFVRAMSRFTESDLLSTATPKAQQQKKAPCFWLRAVAAEQSPQTGVTEIQLKQHRSGGDRLFWCDGDLDVGFDEGCVEASTLDVLLKGVRDQGQCDIRRRNFYFVGNRSPRQSARND